VVWGKEQEMGHGNYIKNKVRSVPMGTERNLQRHSLLVVLFKTQPTFECVRNAKVLSSTKRMIVKEIFPQQ